MATCEICGTEFDELGVQIVLPGLAKSFDRIDCAARARTIAGPPARNVRPARAVFVDAASRGQPRSYSLHGLPAGLAAALASRTRLALGGASLAVALLVATTVHLSSRIGGGSDLSAHASLLPSPPRYAGDFVVRGLAPEARGAKVAPVVDTRLPVVSVPVPQEADGIYLAAQRSLDGGRATSRTASEAQPRSQKRKAARYSRNSSEPTLARAGAIISTRPGWGWGDKNHAHGGPSQVSGSKKLGNSHGRRHK
jgi:hypothetical protein